MVAMAATKHLKTILVSNFGRHQRLRQITKGIVVTSHANNNRCALAPIVRKMNLPTQKKRIQQQEAISDKTKVNNNVNNNWSIQNEEMMMRSATKPATRTK
jgi:hypothetical protein